jgi:hypothetical protein
VVVCNRIWLDSNLTKLFRSASKVPANGKILPMHDAQMCIMLALVCNSDRPGVTKNDATLNCARNGHDGTLKKF